MTRDPFKDARQRDDRNRRIQGLNIGIVQSVPDNSSHQIVVKMLTKVTDDSSGPTPSAPSVMVSQLGDISLPSEGDTVIVARFKSRRPIVLGTIYTGEDPIRDYSADERHIGHEDNGGTYIHGPFGVVPRVSEDPTELPEGAAVWYRDDLDEYRGVENGSVVTFDTTTV